MTLSIRLNGREFEAVSFEEYKTPENLQVIRFDFKVTSEEYHDVAVLLYEPEFDVRIAEKNMEFRAAITEYSTSVTNLYEPGQTADYFLQLTEIRSA